MINKFFNLFFTEKKACVTLIRNTPNCEYENELTYKRNIVKKSNNKTSLSKYFTDNAGLNYVERNILA